MKHPQKEIDEQTEWSKTGGRMVTLHSLSEDESKKLRADDYSFESVEEAKDYFKTDDASRVAFSDDEQYDIPDGYSLWRIGQRMTFIKE